MRNIVVYTLMFSAMIQFLMAVYAWGRRNEPAAKPLILVFVLGGIWAFAYGMDMTSGDLQTKLFWTKVSWAAASFGPLIFLLIVLEHLELRSQLTKTQAAILLIPTLALNILTWTIPHQDLLMHSFAVERVGPLDILQKEYGVLHTPIFLALQGITLVTYYLLIRSFSNTSVTKRQQSIAILIALLIPFFANIPTILNIESVKGFDFTPHALVFSSILFAYAIFRYRWLDIIPLARSTLVENIPVGVIVMDAKGRIVNVNPAAQRFLQMDISVIGQEAHTIFAPFDPILYTQANAESTKKEIELYQKYLDAQALPLKNQDGTFNGTILTLQDITERKQANERLQTQLAEIASLHSQLHEQAIRDPLTGLFNRRYMSSILERETYRSERHQRPLSILMIEIDNFKRINDSFGHEAGDITLKAVAGLIQSNSRSDDVACRFGGDEFVLILSETSLESAMVCAERLREATAFLQLAHEGQSINGLTLSIGIAMFPQHGVNIISTLRAADIAMYQAKQTGKNRVMIAKN
jgi:diguanylate cyclase (GGDEF)-like protein/PAS domain S-box-containing protein